MYRKDELNKIAESHNLTALEVRDIKIYNRINLEFNNIDSFIEFVVNSGFNRIFYSYSYYTKEEYLIPKDYYDAYPKDFVDVVNEHNEMLKKQDFSIPYSLTVFVLESGVQIGIVLEDYWLESLKADEQIEKIEGHFWKEVQQYKQENLKKFKEYILNDPEFEKKKNQEARYWYFNEIIEMEEFKSLLPVFSPIGIYHTGKVKMFMDEMWQKLKDKKSADK